MAAILTIGLVGIGLFATVAFHVVLTQNQFRIDSLRTKATTEQTRYERLRLQVAQLESPERVVAAAQDRLGMVQPPKVSYLAPPEPAAGAASAVPPAAPKGSWSTVKSQLASHP